MSKKKRKSKTRIDWPTVLITGLMDFLVGGLLLLVEYILNLKE